LFEHTQDTIDRLPGVDRVQSADDQVASLGRAQADLNRFAIAHFAHQNDFRARCRAQTIGKAVEIGSHLALIERGLPLGMDELDRITRVMMWIDFVSLISFNNAARSLIFPPWRRSRGSAPFLLGHFLKHIGHLQLCQRGNIGD
jgi:hypothetical protein